jgi:hypothetical protein
MKYVINIKHGGFSLSEKAVDWLVKSVVGLKVHVKEILTISMRLVVETIQIVSQEH